MEYVELERFCEFNRGKTITSKQIVKGEYPVVAGGLKPISYHSEYNREANCITVAGSGVNAGFVNFWDTPVFCSDSFTVDVLNKNILDIKYLYYFLKSKQDYIYSKKTGAGIPHLYGKDLKDIRIPLPPLETQKDIANKLDKFAGYISLLNNELSLRQKQYEYYRDKLLTFGDKVEYVELKRFCEFNRGKNITTKQIIKGEYPVVAGGLKPTSYHSEYNREANCITVAGSGVNAGFVNFWDTPVFCSDSFTVDVLDKNILDIKYLYYFLKSKQDYIYSKKTGAGIPHLYGKDLKDIRIPLPSLEKQREIVDILDKFDTLCNSLTEGLPYEIKLRQKQYEYYRDKLLSFS